MSRPKSAIELEIRQRRPFSSPAQECVVGLFRTADLLKRRLHGTLGARGVTGQQYNVLRILRGAGEGLPTLEIGERMVEHAPGVTRLLDRLERKGLARRARPSGDRRQVRCSITSRGLSLLESLEDVVANSTEESLGALDPREVRSLIRLMDKVRKGLGPTSPDGQGFDK
jgi:DNA-binding MarR family transcriptional regulator